MSSHPRLHDLTPLDPASTPKGIQAATARQNVTPAAAFEGRAGYDAAFLDEFKIDLPHVTENAPGRVAPVEGRDDGRLDYTHFSIVMNEPRRLAFFTAFNLDGRQARSVARGNDHWALDGRLALEAQCGEDLYARNPLDRGHLVRRSAACWGEDAEQANEDTFHFTNCTPQMAAFNQQTWLGLEDYLLGNAVKDKGKVSIFTGPVFKESDRTYRGVQIPEAFWKVVAFRTPDDAPRATAYLIAQDKELDDNLGLFFGQYKTFQKSVARIEALTGLDFGDLRDHDGLSNEERITGARIDIQLDRLGDIHV
ncbi:DNA/RNA non-specific endonuclease [Larsenimonas salina]|uniref:DNA/RNA non-specific endonuclease n=1 Tax=Larsenimonas salina TaxID=1295565 RepID=UPI00207345D2|nr:DNA/RNA non-specific endonuclease [Larsenimonas salina]MCM5704432.1 DNA/RNA non-specific endonuclease [Larsenimonas salina]